LNFGHTLGHAIEAVAGYGTLLHGEAVALGMVAAAQVSAERAGLPKQEIEELVGLIRQFDLPIKLPEGLSRSQILEKVFADKKFVNRKIRFVVTPKLGSGLLVENITVEDLESGLQAIDPSQT
jgi:3-dehydroquinate synthase